MLEDFLITHDKRKTHIVCTIGPASDNKKSLTNIVKAGMDVMRLNFSHGDHEEHKKRIELLREIEKEVGKDVAILLDTKGPEIRTGDFVGGETVFKDGQVCRICTEDIVGTSDRFTITFKELYKDVSAGKFILINDGQISLLVDHIEGDEIVCVCANDGIVKNKRGVNVPDIDLSFPYLSQKDIDDLIFGCEQKVNYVAASFCRRPEDALALRRVLVEHGGENIQIIAKIENKEGVDKIDRILDVVEGVMVARGDLGVEVPAEDVPIIQKELIAKCKAKGRFVITATQMLESMQFNPRPTRAEVSDIANAIYDGTDAIMLSGESAQGKYPVEAVEMMAKVASRIEQSLDYSLLYEEAKRTAPHDTSEAICMSVAEITTKFDIAAIVAFTETGFTARKISRYRPKCPIIAPSPEPETLYGLKLNWGIRPCHCLNMPTTEALLEYAQILAKSQGCVAGDKIIIMGGNPGEAGMTNFLNIVDIK